MDVVTGVVVMKSISLVTKSTKETKAFARRIGETAEEDLFIALSGDLGAGKTHFVQGLAEGLGVTGAVTSPTFNLMNLYEGRLALKHFDFYRLKSEEDLYNIGWDEYSAGGVTVAEWADLFPALIPAEALWMTINVLSDTSRKIDVAWMEDAPTYIIKEITTYAHSH